MKVKLYSNDENGNIIEGWADSGFYDEIVYNDRVWSEKLPEECQTGKIYIMDGVNQGWQLIDDTRGIWYRTDTGKEIIIEKVGISSYGLTKLKPDDDFQKWNGISWELDEEKKEKYEKRQIEIEYEKLLQNEIRKMAMERLGKV